MALRTMKYTIAAGFILCVFIAGCSGSGTGDGGQIEPEEITPRPGVRRIAPQVSTISQIYQIYEVYQVY